MKRYARVLAVCMSLVMITLSGCGGSKGGETGSGDAAEPSSAPAQAESESESESAPEEKAEGSGAPITVQFWNGWTGNDGNVLLEMVEEFNAENPYGITIEMDINSDFQNKIAASFAANEGPDMILGVHTYKFTYPDYLVDMNEIFEATSLEKADWVPSLVDACSMNDTLYVLPFQQTSRYMYWNKDLFEAAGLDPETPPATYEEWAEMAAKITDEDRNVYGSGISYTDVASNLQIMQRFGGLYLDEDGNGSYTANFAGNEGYKKFLVWYKDMVDKGDNPVESDTGSMMQAGQIGIICSGAWLNAGLKDAGLNYGVSLLPDGDAGPMNPSTVSGFSVTKYASDEAKEACFRFIEWWYKGFEDTKATGIMRWSLDCGFPSVYTPATKDERYTSSELLMAMSADPSVDTTYMAPPTFKEAFLLANEVVDPLIQSVILEDVDPDSALDKAQSMAESVVERTVSE